MVLFGTRSPRCLAQSDIRYQRVHPQLSRPARWAAAKRLADAAGVPAGRIRTIPEVYDWEQVRESMVLTLPHPTLGDLDVPGSPLRLSGQSEPRREAPPALGIDQDDVFADYVHAGGCR
jgi:crotonobetainyl-CoA:carnitine CoA-transferase CaiB-like acyl-CoA transferase